MADESVVTVDSVLNELEAKIELVEKRNADLMKQIADQQSVITSYVNHINGGSLNDSQLKKIQDLTERLSKLSS